MNPYLFWALCMQISFQCECAIRAADDINRGNAFYGVQNFLVAVANISKALWAGGGSNAAGRKELRDALGLTDQSPLNDVDMRNFYEHFDKELFKWANDPNRSGLIDLNACHIDGIDPAKMLRSYDPATKTAVFAGQVFSVKSALEEIYRIFPAVQREFLIPPWEKVKK